VNTGFLPVIGLGDVIYHMAISSRKAAGSEVQSSYVIASSRVCVSDPSVVLLVTRRRSLALYWS